jgi:arylsulfatase A-like enzyme/Flp pilus assembly protein TadD
VAAAVLLAVVIAVWWARRTPPAGAIVLVSIDTLRADRLPAYGYTRGKTPALDAFARDAVLFSHAYAHAPQTLPSHASIFTGLLPFEHGVRDNLGFTLSSDKVTLPVLLRQAGYRTGGFVSSYVLRPEAGLNRGFDVYSAEFPEVGADRSPGLVQRAGEQTLAAATRWLDTLADARFFLFFHIYEPHKPYAPPERFKSMDAYDGEVAYADEIVGRLLQDLKRRGWYDNATVIVLSDHGEGLGDHGELEHGLFVYDEVIRVPWIMKLPASRSGGRQIAAPIQHLDLMPTLLTSAGLPPMPSLRGRDLTALLNHRGQLAPQGIYSEALYPRYHFGWSELLSLTDERYRFIKAPREELYDLDRDPDEKQNIVAERSQAASAMRSALDALVAGRAIDAPSAVSAEDRQRLAALGYVGTQSSSSSTQSGATLPDPKDMAPVLRKYREAVDLLEAREFADGADALGTVLKDNPGMTDVWLQYAGVLTKLGRDADALRAYQQVIRLKPEEPAGLLGATAALIALGRLDEAKQHAELAAKNSPGSAHENLAQIALARKDYAEAQRQAALAAQADPQLPLPVYVRGLIQYHEQRYAEAVPLLLQARDAWSARTIQTPDLRFYLGDALAKLERYPEAETAFLEELRIFPGSVRARAGLALLYQATGKTDRVERIIDDMMRVSPSPRTYETAAELWRIFGQADRAAAVRAAARAKFGAAAGR